MKKKPSLTSVMLNVSNKQKLWVGEEKRTRKKPNYQILSVDFVRGIGSYVSWLNVEMKRGKKMPRKTEICLVLFTTQHCVQKFLFFFLLLFDVIGDSLQPTFRLYTSHITYAAINVFVFYVLVCVFCTLSQLSSCFDLSTDALGNKLRCLKVQCKNIVARSHILTFLSPSFRSFFSLCFASDSYRDVK